MTPPKKGKADFLESVTAEAPVWGDGIVLSERVLRKWWADEGNRHTFSGASLVPIIQSHERLRRDYTRLRAAAEAVAHATGRRELAAMVDELEMVLDDDR